MHTIDTADIYTALTENSSILSAEERKGLYLELTNSPYWQKEANSVVEKLDKHTEYYPVQILLDGWKRVRQERTAYCCAMSSLVQLVVLRAWYMRSAFVLESCYTGDENKLDTMADRVLPMEEARDVAIKLMTIGGADASDDVVRNITMCIGKLVHKLHVLHEAVLVKALNEATVIIKGKLDAAF